MNHEDIVPELLKKIQTDFKKLFDENQKILELYAKVRDGTGTYVDANEFAIEAGEILAKVFGADLSSDILPDGRMYYNIAERIIGSMMENNYDLITDVTSQVQKSLNDKAGIGIKPIQPELNQDRIDGIVNRVSETELFDDIAWILDEPIKVFSQSIVDDAIKANAEFQYEAGLNPKIERKTAGKCCDWCRNLAKTYMYPNVPEDVYRRHDYCRCTVDYTAGKTRRNVHNNNTGKRRYVQNQFGGYEKSKEVRIARAKELAATEKERKEAARQKRIATWEQKRIQSAADNETESFKRKFNAVPPEKVVNAMREDSKKWIQSLSDEEIRCIQKYSFNEIEESPRFYERLNAMLRGNLAEDENLRYYANTISTALKKNKLGENVICYRGVDTNPFTDYEIGEYLVFNQFISTSVISNNAFKKPVKIVIYAAEGTNGAGYIETISRYPKQRELLFDKDCVYKVLSNKDNLLELEVCR